MKYGGYFERKFKVICITFFQLQCDEDQCSCHLFIDRDEPLIDLGCFPEENITCPAINGSRIILYCFGRFCYCDMNPMRNGTYHCFEPRMFGDCPITTAPPATNRTTTTSPPPTMPPATPTPEDECPDY